MTEKEEDDTQDVQAIINNWQLWCVKEGEH